VLCAVACFATLDTVSQFLSVSVPIAMAMWFRFGFQAISTTGLAWRLRGRTGLRPQHPRFQWLRGMLLVSSSALAYLSLRYTPVAEFTAIVSVTPLLITLLSALRLQEKVSVLRWALVFGGFVGTLMVIRPDADDFQLVTLLPVALVFTSTAFQLITSRMAHLEDPLITHACTGWIGMASATLLLPWVWTPITSATLWSCLVAVGVFGTVGHFMLLMAYRRAQPAQLTPYLYAQVPLAVAGGWLAFGRVPDGWGIVGIALITACGALGTWLTAVEARAFNRKTPDTVIEPVE
jgi:drug/metabolite transporter (DMT)-like permease